MPGTDAGFVSPAPLIAGPITNADSENITAKIKSPMTGARQVPNRRRRRNRNGIEKINPNVPKSAVPPDPATTAVPARNPM